MDRRKWLERGATVEELLADPVGQAVMRRDGVRPDEVRRLMSEMRARLVNRGVTAMAA